jgi:uncharacterized membrane protein
LTSASSTVDLPQAPVTIADEQVGVNGAIAAALTRWVGSMPALYVVLSVVGGYMALATWGPLHRADPYPFPFLLFLDNVVQLVLCLVILVGQRVLGAAADRRAVQTYENAEAIFAQVADLQAHLDRHDAALSRGVSLLETSAHPWIERHRVQQPPQALDQAVSVNGRIAAWLTRRLGSMQAFYLAAATQVIWITSAQAGIQRFDPYPFAFMTFLSTLAQLIFMLVIMVGQDVLGRAADRRSEQTYLDAEAILHECRRMKARLSAQDRVIDSLAGYATSQVTEQLARAIYDSYADPAREAGREAAVKGSHAPGFTARLVPWDELPEERKEPSRAQARRVGEDLAAIGCLMVPASGPAPGFTFDDHEAEQLARREHERRAREQAAGEATDRAGPDSRAPAGSVPWEQLSQEARTRNVEAVRRMPALLARVGFQVVRDGSGAQDRPREADFAPGEWDILKQAMMASGVLVALAEGAVDAEEIFALVKTLREASVSHPRRFIRELTAASSFSTGLRPGASYAGYEGAALEVIRSAAAIITRKAPAELPGFRAFLAQIAEAVADANREGGFFGLGARRRTGHEAAAVAAVTRAAGPADAGTPD